MGKLFAGLWNALVSFFALLMPFTKDSPWRRLGRGVWFVLHILLVALIVLVLYLVDYQFITERFIPDLPRGFWLPIIFLLVYLLMWTAWWVYKLLVAEPEPSTFPDIDAAWAEAMQALAQAGIRLADWPVFLLLGRPAAPEDCLFQAAQVPLRVKQTPPGPARPIHVYATAEAVYITCPGASVLGQHAARIALEDMGEPDAALPAESPAGDRTLQPGGKERKIIQRLRKAGARGMNVIERRASRREAGFPMPSLFTNQAEVERQRARLAHLVRLLVRERRPLCPINGLLMLLPVGGTDEEDDAQQTAQACAVDLAVLRRVMQLRCPLFVLACDMEALPGFADFVQRVSAGDRLGRIGQRFPLASPDLAGDKLIEQIDRSIHHLCNSYLRDWVYRLFRADANLGREPTATNTGLYLFLDEMRARRKNLSRIVTQGIAREAPLPLLYGGCYLAGTGALSEEQAFVGGVLKRLTENQSYVSWTDQAFAEDLRRHRRANLGYTLLGGLALGLLAAAAYYFFGPKRPQ